MPAAAQDASIGFDAAFNSSYVWRGLSLTNKPVLQPDVWISAYGFTGGAWANVEPSSYTGAKDISENGTDGAGIAEIDLWFEYARATGNVNWKLGWTIYTYDTNKSGLTAFYDTHEFYGQASISGLPVTPQLYVAYDIDKVKGAYIVPSLSYGVKAGPNLTINLTALAGISAGQEVSANDVSANFAKSGLAHMDFGASTSFSAGSDHYRAAVPCAVVSRRFHEDRFAHEPALDEDLGWGDAELVARAGREQVRVTIVVPVVERARPSGWARCVFTCLPRTIAGVSSSPIA